MPLIRLHDLDLGYGGPLLLEGGRLIIERQQRIGVVGRNGAGKSTLLKAIAGVEEPLGGTITHEDGTRIALLDQQVPALMEGSIFDQVARGLQQWGDLLRRHHAVSVELSERSDPSLLKELDRLQHELENDGGWSMHQRVEQVLSRMELDPDAVADNLSAGLKRRILLARALVTQPDVLLLDEPTNHLDLEGITWIEGFLDRFEGTLLFITHDRALLRKLATRIVLIDRAALKAYDCDYDTFLGRHEADLEAEAAEFAERDRLRAQEEAWAKQGVKARRTRSQGRLKALEKLREERTERRKRVGTVRMRVQEAERSGRLVIEALGVSHEWDGKVVLSDFSSLVMRGDRIGIMGRNGAGKTTLLRILLKELAPTAGTVRHGTRLESAYFDQLHRTLDEDLSLRKSVAEGGDMIECGTGRRHVVGYLQSFLFDRERLDTKVRYLSGGERNRLLLARLFAKPSNVLVLDEPTNDLDAETLELLEQLLIEYQGTVLLVSHDREFLNNVVTSTFVLEGEGKVGEYCGGYDDWLLQRKEPEEKRPARAKKEQPAAKKSTGPRRRTYKEMLEYQEIPGRIEALEEEEEQIHAAMSADGFYRSDPEEIRRLTSRLPVLKQELEAAYERWAELDELAE
ncbi:MAG: ATP-binding cassette domain-containing protein [Planctomycetota bacterium]